MTIYASTCLGDGHTPCPDAWHHEGRGFNAAAGSHAATGHAVSTHVVGGPFDQARKP